MTQAAVAASNAGLMTTPSGTAPNYMARAWVNFNGTGTVAIRTSGNVSSITDNGVGDYTVNLSIAMSDVNYAPVVAASANYGVRPSACLPIFTGPPWSEAAPSTTAFRFACADDQGSMIDPKYVIAVVFR